MRRREISILTLSLMALVVPITAGSASGCLGVGCMENRSTGMGGSIVGCDDDDGGSPEPVPVDDSSDAGGFGGNGGAGGAAMD